MIDYLLANILYGRDGLLDIGLAIFIDFGVFCGVEVIQPAEGLQGRIFCGVVLGQQVSGLFLN